eukprot:UN11277
MFCKSKFFHIIKQMHVFQTQIWRVIFVRHIFKYNGHVGNGIFMICKVKSYPLFHWGTSVYLILRSLKSMIFTMSQRNMQFLVLFSN